jgi:hypothetical protein
MGDPSGRCSRVTRVEGAVVSRPYDRTRAAAESRLEALDDAAILEDDLPVEDSDEAEGEPAPPVEPTLGPDDYGFHEDDPEVDLLDDDLDAGLRNDEEADALDAVAEVFNARDLDQLLTIMATDGEVPGLLGYERANLGSAIEDLWQRRPTCCITRGHHLDEHVGVLWEHDGTSWWRVAAVHVDDVKETTIGVLEFTDDPALLEEVVADPPAADELEQGARWAEWEEGVDGD